MPIRTPFPSLDRCLRGGLRAGVSYVAAAPPAGLKTSLLVQVETSALLDGHGVVHITNELPARVMRERYLANLAGYDFGVALEDIGRLHPVDYEARETAQQQLDMMPLFLYESIPTADEIGLRLAKVRAQRRDVAQWLLVLDYIQRLRGDSRQERRHVISDSFDRLQEIARNEGVALVIASSLPMSDWDTSPDTWGGRESGDIRGYTSVFLGLQRHKDADQREPDYLHLTAWLCKNTLGPETQIPMRVRASNQRWEQAA